MRVNKEKIFIAGKRGFLGSALAAKLKSAGYTNIYPKGTRRDDLTNLDNCIRATRGASLIINAAGKVTSRKDQLLHPASIFYTNSLIELQLLEACRVNGISKMVSVSSIHAYGENQKLPFREKYLFSGATPEIRGAHGFYGLSKWLALPAALAYAEEHRIKHRVVIFPNLYGLEDKFDDRFPPLVPNLIQQMVAAANRGADAVNAGKNPNTKLDLLFVDDAADFVIQVIHRFGQERFLAVNAGSGETVTVKSVAELIARQAGYRGKIAWEDSKSSGEKLLDNSQAKKRFGWRPRTSLAEGIKKTVERFVRAHETSR